MSHGAKHWKCLSECISLKFWYFPYNITDFIYFQDKWSDHTVRSFLTSCWELSITESLQYTLIAIEVKQNTDTQKQNPMTYHKNYMFFITFWSQMLNMAFVKEMLENSLVMASGGKKIQWSRVWKTISCIEIHNAYWFNKLSQTSNSK